MIDFRNLKSSKAILRNSGVYLIDCKISRTELDRRKVAVFNAASGSWSAIPIALTPTTVDAAEWDSLVRDGRLIFGVFLKLLRWLQCPAQNLLAKNLFDGLSDFEKEFVTSASSEYWGHVTIRMDLFWHHGKIKIIEVNCTIPAMQAYSDNVFNAWELAGGEAQGESKNSQQLLESLIVADWPVHASLYCTAKAIVKWENSYGSKKSGRPLVLKRFWPIQLGFSGWGTCGWSMRCLVI